MKENRKTRVGTIVSNKMQKTVVVSVKRLTHDPRYRKTIRKVAKYKAHDDAGCQIGDTVRLEETRPLSREKRWRVVEVLTRAHVPEIKPAEVGAEQQP